MIYQACALHEPLASARGGGKVVASHRRAVNLELESGVLMSLLDPSLGNGPGAVLVPGPWPLNWFPDERISLNGGVLRGPHVTIRLEGASLWTPPSPPGWVKPAHDRRRLAEGGAALAAAGNPAGLLPAALAVLGLAGSARRPPDPVADTLLRMGLQGIRSLMVGDWETGVARLVGLGPGATPSGDDLLCGFTCTLVRAGSAAAGAVSAAIRRIPPGATPPLSRHFLNWCTQGVAGEHALALVDAWLRGRGDLTRALPPVLTHGATSGADWASGALLAFDFLGREVSEHEAV